MDCGSRCCKISLVVAAVILFVLAGVASNFYNFDLRVTALPSRPGGVTIVAGELGIAAGHAFLAGGAGNTSDTSLSTGLGAAPSSEPPPPPDAGGGASRGGSGDAKGAAGGGDPKVPAAVSGADAQLTNASVQARNQTSRPPRLVHVFSFHPQMQKMLFQWLLEQGNVLPLHSYGNDSIRLETRMVGSFTKPDIEKAFRQVEASKPWLALWLFPFKDGDRPQVLPMMKQRFAASARAGIRHGVFHWSPEFCNQNGATQDAIVQAYKAVEFVFMFGYLDERLAKTDKQKFIPFPLGPALLRGWQTPKSVLPTGKRELIAAYRGSAQTHQGLLTQMQQSVKALAPKDREKVVLEERKSWTMSDSEQDHKRYLYLLANSRFAVSPEGHNPNTYRISEAVESGSTPILVASAGGCYENWAGLYGHFSAGGTRYSWIPRAPFLMLSNWSDLGGALRAKMKDNSDATKDLLEWYHRWRWAFRAKLNQFLNAHQ